MKIKILVILCCIVGSMQVCGQSVFNGLLYQRPGGFQRVDSLAERLALQKQAGKQYCQLFIYAVQPSADDAAKNFNKHWDFFARKAEQGVKDPETLEVDSADGWIYTFGAARGKYLGQMFAVTVSSRTGAGYTYFVATVVSDQQFLTAAEQFTNSVKPSPELLAVLKKPSETPIASASIPATFNHAALTTEFNDGWVSRYHGKYVSVSKGDLQAWIFPVNDSLDKINRQPNARFEDKYWQYAVDQHFNTRNIITRNRTMVGPGSDDIFEAEVLDKVTRKQYYLAMRVICNSGRCQPVLALAPSQASMYSSVFAGYNSFEEVLPYNHFQPSTEILTGTWQSFTSGATGTFSMAGGFQGGSGRISFTDGFVFRANGTYDSKQGTARGTATKGFERNTTGNYTLSGTTLRLTNRGADDPGEFECWLEAFSGGLQLRMVNKKFTGQNLSLQKISD